MKLKSISVFFLVVFMFSACTKKSSTSSNPGRTVTVVPTDTTDVTDTTSTDDTSVVDDLDRSSGDEIADDTVTTSTVSTASNILFNNYRYSIPSSKVCQNILQSKDVSTLGKFFRWDLQNVEGPVTVCIEQESATPTCPNGENYCSNYPNKHVRIRIEYEDDLRFWYYDSEKSTNYAKLLSYTGGAGANTLEIILQDGAGFLKVEGFKTSSGKYDVGFAFADRPAYSAARAYDESNGFTSTSAGRRAATYADMKACAQSIDGTAKASDGSDCASRFVLAYQFFGDLNSYYLSQYPTRAALITDTSLWVKNQVTIARQYVNNQFPSQFATYGVVGGTFGRLLLNGH